MVQGMGRERRISRVVIGIRGGHCKDFAFVGEFSRLGICRMKNNDGPISKKAQ